MVFRVLGAGIRRCFQGLFLCRAGAFVRVFVFSALRALFGVLGYAWSVFCVSGVFCVLFFEIWCIRERRETR